MRYIFIRYYFFRFYFLKGILLSILNKFHKEMILRSSEQQQWNLLETINKTNSRDKKELKESNAVLAAFFLALLLTKKETYIYCQIGTKLLTSLSGDPLNAHIWSKIRIKRAATYIVNCRCR